MASPRPPPKLNFQDPHWDAWRSSFQTFRAETKLDLECEDIQISTLKYSMGPESERMFESFALGPHCTYDQVLAKFDWYFKAKKKNLMTLRRAFQKRAQQEQESASQFCEALKKSASECEFCDENERVRDQFVFGVRNKNLSLKLEQLYVIDPVGFTLEKVVMAAKAFERSYGHDFMALKQRDSKERRVRSLKGSIKIVAPT